MLKPTMALMLAMTLCHASYANDWMLRAIDEKLLRTNRLIEQVAITNCLQTPRCVVDTRLLDEKGLYHIQMDTDGHIKGRGDK